MAVNRDLRITRIYEAPRELVFSSFVNESLMCQWWGPRHFSNPRCELDPRPGGIIRIDMRDPEGIIYPMKGVYLEVHKPERLVFKTSAFENEAGVAGLEDRTTILFEDLGGKTRLDLHTEITKAEPGTEQALEGMEQGWNESLDRLQDLLSSCEAWVSPHTVFSVDPDRPEVVITSSIPASRDSVYRAYTDPKLIPQWWGLAENDLSVDKLDVRPGGSWRFIERDRNGVENGFHGEYRQISPNDKLVSTFEWEGLPGHVIVETIELKEENGETRIVETLSYPSIEERDSMVQTGMEEGSTQSLERLANLWRKCHLDESASAQM